MINIWVLQLQNWSDWLLKIENIWSFRIEWDMVFSWFTNQKKKKDSFVIFSGKPRRMREAEKKGREEGDSSVTSGSKGATGE